MAADYHALQGLITVGLGLGLVVAAVGATAYASIVIALGVVFGTVWYDRHIGRAAGRSSLLRSVALVMTGLAACLVAVVVDRVTTWSVVLLPLVAAGVLAVSFRVGYRHVGVTPIHWTAAGLVGVSAFLPLVGVSSTSGQRPADLYAAPADTVALVVLAVALVVIGITDHTRLVRAMRPVPHD